MNHHLSLQQDRRAENWQRLAAMTEVDVLIIGGGVNGVAVLRDLALNGLRVALVDQGDFCGGASSASSRMAHGGLRYLEGREFRLVAEAARERNMLLHDAPHWVHPLEIVVPLQYRLRGLISAGLRFMGLSRRPGPLSLAALGGALMIYERFGAARRALPSHRLWSRTQAARLGLAGQIRAVVSYYDGQILSPEALVLDMLDEALAEPDAVALNHVNWRAEAPGRIALTDNVTGQSLSLSPRVIVNAAGAGIDRVNAALGLEGTLVRGVKGAHLLLQQPEVSRRMAGRAFYFDDGGGRMVICLPVGDCILMGTTEVETSDPQDKRVAEAEVDYLLGALSRLFEGVRVERRHIVAATTGIRPLQAGGGSTPQAARDHALVEGRAGAVPVLSLVGGKWTTFRSFAEGAADRVLVLLGQPRRITTAARRYPVPALAEQIAADCQIPQIRAAQLVARYGAAAGKAALACAGRDVPLPDLPQSYSAAEIAWLVQNRMAQRLEDLVLRRSNLVATGALTLAGLRQVAQAMAGPLGQDEIWIQRELDLALGDPRILGFQQQRGMP